LSGTIPKVDPKATITKVSTLLSLVLCLVAAGCTAVKVNPLDASRAISHICIKDNPKVIVPDFLSIVRDGFEEHGITSEVISGQIANECDAVLTYTALRNWDLTPYLSHAELRIEDLQGTLLASAEYHISGGSVSLDLTKWDSVESKMKPVIDELLSAYHE